MQGYYEKGRWVSPEEATAKAILGLIFAVILAFYLISEAFGHVSDDRPVMKLTVAQNVRHMSGKVMKDFCDVTFEGDAQVPPFEIGGKCEVTVGKYYYVKIRHMSFVIRGNWDEYSIDGPASGWDAFWFDAGHAAMSLSKAIADTLHRAYDSATSIWK